MPWHKSEKIIATIIGVIGAIIVACIPFICNNEKAETKSNETTVEIKEISAPGKEKEIVENTYKEIITPPLGNFNEADSLLFIIRKEKNLRQLTPLESGKSLKDIPNRTYGYLSIFYLTVKTNEAF